MGVDKRALNESRDEKKSWFISYFVKEKGTCEQLAHLTIYPVGFATAKEVANGTTVGQLIFCRSMENCKCSINISHGLLENVKTAL